MINLEIVTPEKTVIDKPVEAVYVPTAAGEIGILENHAPLISSLKPGILSFTVKGNTEKLVIAGGFVEVSSNQVSILADIAENADVIDSASAKIERDEAQKVLGDWKGSEEEFEIELEKLEKAQARLQLSSGR
jgi:F-type H+-transporting ATPase subunit epsilon